MIWRSAHSPLIISAELHQKIARTCKPAAPEIGQVVAVRYDVLDAATCSIDRYPDTEKRLSIADSSDHSAGFIAAY